MATLKRGDHAPDFTLLDQDGKPVKLADHAGSNLLLYFYPKADTPGCTTQACCLRDAIPDFAKSGVRVVGISPDEPAQQKQFADKYGLNFPLLSDPDHQAADAYGVWGEKSMYGKTYLGIIRSSFLIDAAGVILDAWYKVSPDNTVAKARETL